MDWYTAVFELIDMRSFSNLWFWIALAVLWSSVSHRVLGVPWDMVMRAKTAEGQPRRDLEDMVRVNVNRLLYITSQSGELLAGFVCFTLTALVLLGFVYEREFAQALFLLGFPLSIIALLSARTARLVHLRDLRGTALVKQLSRHRLWTQLIGMVSIFVTAIWGMLQNFSASALGG